MFASFLWDFGIHYEDSVCLGRLLLWQVGLLPQSECKLAEIRSIFVFVSLLWVSIMSFLSCDKKKETTNFSSCCALQGFRRCNCVYSELNIGRSQELISFILSSINTWRPGHLHICAANVYLNRCGPTVVLYETDFYMWITFYDDHLRMQMRRLMCVSVWEWRISILFFCLWMISALIFWSETEWVFIHTQQRLHS